MFPLHRPSIQLKYVSTWNVWWTGAVGVTFQEEFAEDVGRENPASSATCGAVFNPLIWRDFPSKLGGVLIGSMFSIACLLIMCRNLLHTNSNNLPSRFCTVPKKGVGRPGFSTALMCPCCAVWEWPSPCSGGEETEAEETRMFLALKFT